MGFSRWVFAGLFLAAFAFAEKNTGSSQAPIASAPSGVGFKMLGTSNVLADRSMNPAISANGLFLGAWGDGLLGGFSKGLHVQEVETVFTAAIDPYFFGNIVLSYEPGATTVGDIIEEAYATTLSIPYVTFKLGKFRTRFGKNNLVHTHAQPLIDRPLVINQFFGDGFNSVGVEGAFLVPVSWYFDLIVGAYRAQDSAAFDTINPEQIALMVRMDHLFDITDATTMEIGGTVSVGENATSNKTTYYGGDLTFKYIQPKGRGTFALVWSNEFIYKNENLGGVTNKPWGAYSTLMGRLGQQWWVGARGDYMKDIGPTKSAENLILAYVPSEFSTVRLQGGLSQPQGGGDTRWQALLQYNMTVGSHPAHAY